MLVLFPLINHTRRQFESTLEVGKEETTWVKTSETNQPSLAKIVLSRTVKTTSLTLVVNQGSTRSQERVIML